MSTERELQAMNDNLKTIAVNQAMIYDKLLRLEGQRCHSSTANTPSEHR